MTRFGLAAIVSTGLMTLSSAAGAQTTGYTANQQNRAAWTAAVGSGGGTVTNNISFDTGATGASIVASNNFAAAASTVGPGQSNDTTVPVSTGEGASSVSMMRLSSGSAFSLTVDFSSAVSAVGLDVIDYFGPPTFNNVLTLSAYSGLGGTGTLLGSYDSARFNFQTNNVYFMGLTSTSNNISSLIFSRTSDGGSGDRIGIDNIRSGTLAAVSPAVPEPATWGMMILGFGVVGASMRRRKSNVRTSVSFA